MMKIVSSMIALFALFGPSAGAGHVRECNDCLTLQGMSAPPTIEGSASEIDCSGPCSNICPILSCGTSCEYGRQRADGER